MAERLASDIAADLRGQRAGLVLSRRLLVEAADKLDGLIDCLATAERERDLALEVNERASFTLKQLRAEAERMRPVVEAAKAWRRFIATVTENGTMFIPENELIAAVDALESSGFDPSLGEATEEQEVPKDCPRCGGLDGTHTVRNCGEHRPVAGDDFMQSGWCGGCEACGPAPQVCVVCSYPDRAPNHPVDWPCEFAPAEASTEEAVQ